MTALSIILPAALALHLFWRHQADKALRSASLAIRATNSADLERHTDDCRRHNGLIPERLFTYYAIGAFNRRSERRRSERLAEIRGGGA